MLFGLGWAEWLLIVGLVGGLLITFKVMARASVAYARAREMREGRRVDNVPGGTGDGEEAPGKEER